MNITMHQDSISSRVRVRRGKKRRARNMTMAAAKAPSRAITGHRGVAGDREHTSTRAASARHRISMDRVLRTRLPWTNRRGYRAQAADGRHFQFLNRAPHLRVTLQQRRIGGHRLRLRRRVTLELDVGSDAPVIDGYSRRRVIERRGELDGAVPGQGSEWLHRAPC